ncbi:hypothetical protein BDF19DRAFT_452418 [Syncephalis fuscata]|nr:hypothetical protein BDF19DRAFT_452418 [Syncephalis fuscata]
MVIIVPLLLSSFQSYKFNFRYPFIIIPTDMVTFCCVCLFVISFPFDSMHLLSSLYLGFMTLILILLFFFVTSKNLITE